QGQNWIGVVLPVGRMSVEQMHGLAAIARDLGDGDLRLTVWQNLLIPGVPTEKLEEAQHAIEALDLAIHTNALRSGLIACTGNTGCKFAASDTKRHAEDIAAWCETRVALDTPVNIHLTAATIPVRSILYIGDRFARLQGSGERRRRSGRGLSHSR